MALMSAQAISSVITPSFSQPAASDTITPDSGLILYVKNGATTTDVTIVVPGNQVYSGVATTDLTVTVVNAERVFYLPPSLVDPATGVITVSYTGTRATVTTALLKI